MDNPKTFEYSGMQFYAKKNCKDCRYTPGYVTRSFPLNDGKKGKRLHKTLCHCVTEVKKPTEIDNIVPRVSADCDGSDIILIKEKNGKDLQG